MQSRHRLILCVLLTVGLLAASCGPATPPQPTPTPTPTPTPDTPAPKTGGGTIIMGLEGDPERMLTNVRPMASAIPVHQLLFSPMVEANPEMEFVPVLAEKIDFSADGLTITFHLRQDVYWHDGEQLTAHDVAFTYNLMALPDNFRQDVAHLVGAQAVQKGEAQTISGIKVLNDYTISFTSASPFAPAMSTMTYGIMPKHLLEGVPIGQIEVHEFNYKAIGSGPFKLVEYVPDRHVILDANDDYFLGRPNIDRIILRIASHEALISSWLREEIDIVPLPMTELGIVARARHGYALEYESERPTYLGINTQSIFFEDARVRQAVYWAVDRQQLVDVALQGNGFPINQVHPPQMWAYNPSLTLPKRDVTKAGALLDAAGWTLNSGTGIREKNGKAFEVELWYVTDREAYMPNLAALIQAQLRDAGVQVHLRSWDSPSMWSICVPRGAAPDLDNYHDFVLASISVGKGDPAWMDRYLASRSIPPGGANYMLFNNEKMDQMLAHQAGLMDFETRKAYWHNEIWPFLIEQCPFVGLLAPSGYFAVNNRIEGFQPASNSRMNNVLHWRIVE